MHIDKNILAHILDKQLHKALIWVREGEININYTFRLLPLLLLFGTISLEFLLKLTTTTTTRNSCNKERCLFLLEHVRKGEIKNLKKCKY